MSARVSGLLKLWFVTEMESWRKVAFTLCVYKSSIHLSARLSTSRFSVCTVSAADDNCNVLAKNAVHKSSKTNGGCEAI
jgi:hypothetical protein